MTTEKPKTTKPPLSEVELIAADLLDRAGGGGDARAAKIADLRKRTEAAETDADQWEAVLREAHGSAASQAELRELEERNAKATARRQAAIDALLSEQAAVEAALEEGKALFKELGEPPLKFFESEQGRALVAKASSIGHAAMRLGVQHLEPPEPLRKAVAARKHGPSRAFRDLSGRIEEIAKALRIGKFDARAKTRELDPEAFTEASRAVLDLDPTKPLAKLW